MANIAKRQIFKNAILGGRIRAITSFQGQNDAAAA
jgi:hypothetical protein